MGSLEIISNKKDWKQNTAYFFKTLFFSKSDEKVRFRKTHKIFGKWKKMWAKISKKTIYFIYNYFLIFKFVFKNNYAVKKNKEKIRKCSHDSYTFRNVKKCIYGFIFLKKTRMTQALYARLAPTWTKPVVWSSSQLQLVALVHRGI